MQMSDGLSRLPQQRPAETINARRRQPSASPTLQNATRWAMAGLGDHDSLCELVRSSDRGCCAISLPC